MYYSKFYQDVSAVIKALTELWFTRLLKNEEKTNWYFTKVVAVAYEGF